MDFHSFSVSFMSSARRPTVPAAGDSDEGCGPSRRRAALISHVLATYSKSRQVVLVPIFILIMMQNKRG
ncbi:hypothetical protein PIB30_023297 [Stylosanthes scabra]|uniref:Uncharacterized protein n=1 Tax=Stylosanthes scabra TaxID=79078 RepID=A0ABU6Q9E0_9FABA|nr:hypothetical protein [Stylosanthes scabra]